MPGSELDVSFVLTESVSWGSTNAFFRTIFAFWGVEVSNSANSLSKYFVWVCGDASRFNRKFRAVGVEY